MFQNTFEIDGGIKNITVTSFKSALMGLLFSVVILSVFAVIITYTQLSEKYIGVIALLATVSGALLAGLLASVKIKAKGWLTGVAAALWYFLMLLVIGLTAYENSLNFAEIFKKIPLYILIGMLGGIIGVNIRRK